MAPCATRLFAGALTLLGPAGCSLLLFDSDEYVSRRAADAGGGEAATEPTAQAKDAFIVVAGGATDTNHDVLSRSVFASKVGADGELGPWIEWSDNRALPEARNRAGLVAAGSTLLFIGGYTMTDGSRPSLFQSTFIEEPSPWTTAPSMPASRGRLGAVRIGGRLYVTGGRGSGTATTTSVLVAPLDEAGVLGPFAEARPLPAPRELHVAAAYGTHLWVIAGYDTATSRDAGDAWVTAIAADGALGAFQPVAALPNTMNTGSGVATSTHVYVVGGYSNGGTFGRVWASKHRGDGTLEGWTAPPSLLTPRAGNATVEVNGRLYTIGGLRSGGALVASVEVATILQTGELSGWKETTALPRPLSTHSATVVIRARASK